MWNPADARPEAPSSPGERHARGNRATDVAEANSEDGTAVLEATATDPAAGNGARVPNPADGPFFAPGPTDQPVLRRRRIGEVLVSMGVLTEDQLLDCLAAQAKAPAGQRRKRLGAIVVERRLATDREVIQALADAMQLEVIDLAVTKVDAIAARLVPRAVSERHLILGVKLENNVLTVATSDPTNIVALDDIRLYAKTEVVWVVASEKAIRQHLNRIWSIEEDSSDVTTLFEDDEDLVDDGTSEGANAEATPVVRLVNVVLADAVRAEASDIHIEPQLRDVRIRYRVDGLLRDVMNVPRSAAAGLISRVKIISGLDIAERRRPQDGRTRLHVDNESIDARVATLPTMHGEKIVIRLLSRSDAVPPLARSGFEEKQLETILNTMVVPEGLILITGPTGSGKTTTLYSAINQLRNAERNIVTLEDPIEIALTGINQVQVHERSGLTFARGLRSILRQDPDIVLVGEVRDMETAELALQASLTGHLVLTTLHTNDAASAITRLVDMGMEPFLVASSLSMVVAQRLVRTPCLTCAAPYMPSPRTLALLGMVESDVEGANLTRGRGCGDCGGTGYRGRTGIFEVLPVTAAIRGVLLSTPNEAAIEMAAHASGMLTLRAHGLLKALRGETTLEEVLRVTHVDADSGTRCVACDRGLGEDMLCCPWCGTPVDRGHCGECRRQLDPEWRVCPWCRTPAATPAALDSIVESAAAHRPDRVLVVDDDLSICAYVAAALEGTCEVIATPDAETALRRCATEEFDGAIIDLVLPDLTGIELARLLRGDPKTAVMPILLMTGTDDRRTEAEALHAGADDYLMKPIDPELLQERVRALLERSKQTAASAAV